MSAAVKSGKGASQRTRRAGAARSTVDALKAFIANAPVAVAMTDRDLRFIAVSQVWLDDVGLHRDRLIGKTSHEVLPETKKYDALHRQILRGCTLSGEPELVLLPSGREQWMSWTASPWRDDRGRIGGMLLVSNNITPLIEAQDDARRTRAFLETVIDNLPAGLTVKEADTGRLLIANQASARLYGIVHSGDHIGRTHAEVFSPELATRFSAQDQEVIQTGEARLFEEEPVPTPEGVRYLNQRKVLIRSPDGRDYLLSISEDVTERRKAVEELERTRAFLETVIDSVPAGITVKDTSTGRLLITNPAVEEIFGVARGENLGKTNRDVFTGDQADRFTAQDREIIAAGGARTYEDELVQTKAGPKFLRRKKVLVRNSEGPNYLLSICEDVTDRKHAQDALREALARAEQANVAKSEFLANMSHEIRTPLNGVLGLADALSRMELTPQQREIVGMIVGSGRALTAILSDVLDLAKAEAGQLQLAEESFSLAKTIGEAAFLFKTVAEGKGIGFRVDLESGGPDQLIGDPLRIKQVVSNLISNAVKFTAKGEVAVHIRTEDCCGGCACLTVSVSDTGPGFTEEVRAKLFQRFQQGDGSITRRYGGTGLGLSIANALALMMNGEVDCKAAPGQGATFVFRAKLKIDQAAPEARPAHEVPTSALNRRVRVLLAEDHEVNQKVVQLMLAGTADLVIVADGQDAVEAALGPGRFDVVLMDTQMPVMDGLTAIRLIREGEARQGLARTPIISLTANAMAHQVEASLQAGADLHLAKPITADALYAAIETALDAAVAEASAA